MQAAKQAVSEFLHHGNKHTVDIEQETKPAIVHERVAQSQHENVTQAVDREVHQHHHQVHVQPIKDQVMVEEKHHHNLIPVEHKHHHHGKDQEIQNTLQQQAANFKDEQEVLPVKTTSSNQTVVGEHVHHHIHDIIQPVIERETVQPHVVHTTVPIHEKIEHEPFIHKGNVLPTMSMNEFTSAGHSLKGFKKDPEHIEYEGEPLKIDGQSHVGFGGLGKHGNTGNRSGMTGQDGVVGNDGVNDNSGLSGNSGISGNTRNTGMGNTFGNSSTGGTQDGAYTHSRGTRGEFGNASNDIDETVPRSVGQDQTTGNTSGPVHKSSLLNKLDPRVDSTTTRTNV